MTPTRSLLSRFVVALACLGAAPAFAHQGDHWPIAGDSLSMSYTPNGSGTKFLFKTKSQVNINAVSIAQSPVTAGAWLLVKGTGASPSSTGLIPLDASRWTPIGDPTAPTGWKYKGDPAYTKGVSKIQIKAGKTNGSLQIQAKGYYWPFQIMGPQDAVQVELVMGDYAFCAEFSADRNATFAANDAGNVVANYALAPSECPSVCGNGILETGEQCDDGNDVNNDTCSNQCVGCDPASAQFASTYEGIQSLIFDSPTYNCSNDACHGSNMAGGLDLRAGASHANLVEVASSIQPTTQRAIRRTPSIWRSQPLPRRQTPDPISSARTRVPCRSG